MDDQTLKALKGSIAKWEAIVAGTGRDAGTKNCPLCKLFYFKKMCGGCPVFEKTQEPYCSGTPHQELADLPLMGAYSSKGIAISDIAENSREHGLELAKAELEFLKSLLPTEQEI